MAEKHTKEEVDYGKGMGTIRCYLCEHFEPPDACELVEGRIRPEDWCKLFERDRGRSARTS